MGGGIIVNIGDVNLSALPRHIWVLPELPCELVARGGESWCRIEFVLRILGANQGRSGHGRRVDDTKRVAHGLWRVVSMIFQDGDDQVRVNWVHAEICIAINLVWIL